MKRIYMDYAATTPTSPEVLDAMRPYMLEDFGNPSSIHSFGREAKKALDDARGKVASLLSVAPEEIVFTSGGSESTNLAIKGCATANAKRGRHIITSSIEHHACLDAVKYLARNGFEATYLPVDGDGVIDLNALRAAIRDDTVLVSVIHASNEVGTIQPVKEIIEIAHEKGALVHLDSVQTVGAIPVNIRELGADLVSMSAHKFYGPKGVGALYVRKGVRITPLIHGGPHEKKRRAGTQNVAGAVGMAKALELAVEQMDQEVPRLTRLREKMIDAILSRIDHVRINGHRTRRLPNNVNVSIEYVEGEAILLNLDVKGIAVSSGSACSSESLSPSHVLLAMGVPPEVAHGSLRLSMGRGTTEDDVDYVVEALVDIVAKLRQMSPLYVSGPCDCKG
ncbi:MAG: cysteine desulfurase NifS [Bacillota bacterium]|jgi:cysteine desulfurase|nr:cysteine desulfurase NifS [Bacillota bacterium]HOB90490.1 cysteine desulfurase NifS [Bacillota bacterium]HPZ53770.1 cysteine desulfurase NifS [Bacillota bacterium]HQD17278.1 cysteine desulfurase NifS [Bacillota bacterium]